MVARQIRAYDGSGNPTFYYKDVGDTADGTSTNPDQSAVILRPGGIVGSTASVATASGNILETLHYIAANLGTSVKSFNIALTTTASVGTTLTTVLDVVTADYQALSIRLNNTGTVALNDLQVQGFESTGFPFDYQLLAASSISTSYSTGTGKQSGNSLIAIVDTSGTLPAIPASGKSGILINCKYYQRIRIQATVASSTTSLSVAGTLMS